MSTRTRRPRIKVDEDFLFRLKEEAARHHERCITKFTERVEGFVVTPKE